MSDAKKKFTPPKRIYLQCPDNNDDGGPLDLLYEDVLGYVDDPDGHSVAYILDTGNLRETVDCPDCIGTGKDGWGDLCADCDGTGRRVKK